MSPRRRERNAQVRMSSTLWNQIGEIGRDLGYDDARGPHSAVIREMVAAAAAKWTHSPYVCRSARHTIVVTKEGDFFSRTVQRLRLNSTREKLPCLAEMKPEKRQYYHRKFQEKEKNKEEAPDEHSWFLQRWLLNYFAVWAGKKDLDDVSSFSEPPLSSHVDTFGTTDKGADLPVNAVGGRFLTREISVALLDYVQWKEEKKTPIFDRVDIPIDIPTTDLEVSVIVDQDLFHPLEGEEIAKLALEFRNRESARFEGTEVVAYPELSIDQQSGRAQEFSIDDGADEMRRKVLRLRERFSAILETKTTEGDVVAQHANREKILSSLRVPSQFLFYRLRWPSPHLGIEVCVHWEKPPARR